MLLQVLCELVALYLPVQVLALNWQLFLESCRFSWIVLIVGL